MASIMNDLDYDLLVDYATTTVKLLLACSPILAIVAVLLMANETDEEEQAKRDFAKKHPKK